MGTLEEYITEFQRLTIMVPKISEDRLVYPFIEGLLDLLHGLVSTLYTTTHKEEIQKATQLNSKTRERERDHSKREDKHSNVKDN